jgi:hypothetical protein
MIEQYQDFQTNRTNQRHQWDIGRWLRSHGVTVQDLDTHPRIPDVILLINIRTNLWHAMNSSEQAVWGAYWSIVYHKRRPLNHKALTKFERITLAVDQRQLQIKILRQIGSATKNIGQDNKAKGPCLPPVTDTKREPQECRQMPEDPQWVPW